MAWNVVFTRFLQPAELPCYYALSDVFVFPRLGDVHGMAVDEAMAGGLPIIASSAVSDIGIRVIDGESGYVAPPQKTLQSLRIGCVFWHAIWNPDGDRVSVSGR